MREKGTCEKCGRRTGDNYSFYYGKKKSRTTQWHGRTYTNTTSYAIGGKREAAACDWCIRWRRVLEAVQPVLGIAACALFGWWIFSHEGLTESMVRKLEYAPMLRWTMTAFAGIGILFGIHALHSKLFGSKVGPGERLLIALKKGELRRQGFDSFWDTASFDRLR